MEGREPRGVHAVLAPGLVVVGLLAGGGARHREGARGGVLLQVRRLAGRPGVLLVAVQAVDGGVRVPRRGDAGDRLRLVRDLGRAVEADEQAGDEAHGAQLQQQSQAYSHMLG